MTKYINRSQFGGIAGNRGGNPKAVFIHNDASHWDANEWANGQLAAHNPEAGFAHYYISDGVVFRAEDTYNQAWHCGNSYWNRWGLSYEICDSYGDLDKFKRSEQECFKQVAEDMEFYGLEPNRDTVRLHQEVFATACPHRSFEIHGQSVNKVKDYFISQIKKYMNGGSDTSKKDEPETYLHSGRVKKVITKRDTGLYDGCALTKAKMIAKIPKGTTLKVTKSWFEGNKETDLSRFQVEYKGKTGWVSGNDDIVESAYWLMDSYGGKHKVKMLVDDFAYEKKDLSGRKTPIKKGDVYTVAENVTDGAGYPRLKLKSGLYITALKSFTKWI